MKSSEKQLNNLKSFKKGEYSEVQRKGTEASITAKRELKEIREWAEQNLFKEIGDNKTPLYEMLFKKLEQLCSKGNIKAIEMLLNYSGLKPVDKIENTTPVVITTKLNKEETKEFNDYIINSIKSNRKENQNK